jgi:hypothetical protein
MGLRTALKRRLLSARASRLGSAHARAVVTSAADHIDSVGVGVGEVGLVK